VVEPDSTPPTATQEAFCVSNIDIRASYEADAEAAADEADTDDRDAEPTDD
jgi:hypothetical protein